MKDANSIIYAPAWVKLVAIILFVLALFVAVYVAVRYVGKPDSGDYILTAMSLAQIALSGLAVTVVIFFSQREIGLKGLVKKTKYFLTDELFLGLGRIEYSPVFCKAEDFNLNVRVSHSDGAIGATYRIFVADSSIYMRVNLNVMRFIVLYYFPCVSGRTVVDLEALLEAVLAGARNAGYEFKIRRQTEFLDGDCECDVLYLYNNQPEGDFLINSMQRLFWIQDIILMTRSVLIESKRNGVILFSGD